MRGMAMRTREELQARYDLTGRVAIITGGSRGIGRAISLSFAMQHAAVAAGYSSYKEAAFMRTGQVSGSNGGPDM